MLIETLTGFATSPILAYLDPSLGSVQFQILIASLLSAGFFLKTHLVQARHLICHVFKRGE